MSTRQHRHHLPAQAPVPPIDADGVAVAAIGTAVFAVLTVIAVLERGRLIALGHDEWLPISLCGVLLGVIGLLYCLDRRRRRRT